MEYENIEKIALSHCVRSLPKLSMHYIPSLCGILITVGLTAGAQLPRTKRCDNLDHLDGTIVNTSNVFRRLTITPVAGWKRQHEDSTHTDPQTSPIVERSAYSEPELKNARHISSTKCIE